MKYRLFSFIPSLLCLLLVSPVALAQNRTPDFTKEVRPILAKNCFTCHGPDKQTRKARLRLDSEKEAHTAVIVPGQPEKSELIARINSDDPFSIMPPPSTKHVLTAEQKTILKRWIQAGAKYESHWAFRKPATIHVPKVDAPGWSANPIDAFVLTKLKDRGLKPNSKADRYTLIRRVSLDLTGLPPTVEEIEAFIKDKSPDAYETVVDRLLASPRYGERWARKWLDLARYADTNGYEKDRARTIWPYRDWVINAINKDMPFDQFTIEQLAGDLLPNPSPEQIIATGFHRNTMLNEEGGVDPLEFRYYAVVDRVNTTATTWLGLTMSCAQCHTHKYDPVTQTEYYRFMAFLNNADEPDYHIPDKAITNQRKQIQSKIRSLLEQLPRKFPGGEQALNKSYQRWLESEEKKTVRWQVITPNKMSTNLPYLHVLDDGSILVGGDQTKSDTYALQFPQTMKNIRAVRLEALPHESLPNHGPGRTYYEGKEGDFFLSEFGIKIDGKSVAISGASHDHAKGAFGAAKVGAPFCYDGKPETGWSTTDRPGQEHQVVFQLTDPVDINNNLSVNMLFERHYSCGLGRFRISVSTDNKPAQASGHGKTIQDILSKPSKDRTAAEKAMLFRRFLQRTPQLAAARKKINQLQKQMPTLQTTMVMRERPAEHPRETFRHHRGEFLSPKEKVTAGVPSALNPFPAEFPKNRLGLAKWLVSADNPLTARVVVNRQWQELFGRGLVKTSEDFGIQGSYPSHPQLLDWLAQEFVRLGWSRKKLHKLIVMSQTYQQSSQVNVELAKVDPDNELLARGPRVRMEAEMIRDSLLQASGLLSEKMGGPSVFPPQPPSVTTEGVYGAIKWKVSQGEDRYRRGLYTFLKRSIPYAMFSTFDGVTGEVCQARREISNTPLQALTMLNDIVVMESAQALGKKLASRKTPPEARMRHLMLSTLSREPTDREMKLLLTFHRSQKQKLLKNNADAQKIANTNAPNVADQAAWTLVARAIFNLDEFVTKE